MLELFQLRRETDEVERFRPWWDRFCDYLMYCSLLVSSVTSLIVINLDNTVICNPVLMCGSNKNIVSNMTSPKNCGNATSLPVLLSFQNINHYKVTNEVCSSSVYLTAQFAGIILIFEAAVCIMINNFWYLLPGVVSAMCHLSFILKMTNDIGSKKQTQDFMEYLDLLFHDKKVNSEIRRPCSAAGDSDFHKGGGGSQELASQDQELEEVLLKVNDVTSCPTSAVSDQVKLFKIPIKTAPCDDDETEAQMERKARYVTLGDKLVKLMTRLKYEDVEEMVEVAVRIEEWNRSLNGNSELWYIILSGIKAVLSLKFVAFDLVFFVELMGIPEEGIPCRPSYDYGIKYDHIFCILKTRRLLIWNSIFIIVLLVLFFVFSFAGCWSVVQRKRRHLRKKKTGRGTINQSESHFYWYLLERSERVKYSQHRFYVEGIDAQRARKIKTDAYYCKGELLQCTKVDNQRYYKINASKFGLPTSLFLPKVDGSDWILQIEGLDMLYERDFMGFSNFSRLRGIEISGCHDVAFPSETLYSLEFLKLKDLFLTQNAVLAPKDFALKNEHFIDAPNLKTVDVMDVRPMCLFHIDRSIELQRLHIEDTEIENFLMFELIKVNKLSFWNVVFQAPSFGFVEGIVNLHSLEIRECDLEDIPLIKSDTLTELNLSCNKIKVNDTDVLTEFKIKHLKLLDLTNNRIEGLHENLLRQVGLSSTECTILVEQNPLESRFALSDISLRFAMAKEQEAAIYLDVTKYGDICIDSTELPLPEFPSRFDANATAIMACEIDDLIWKRRIRLYMACISQLLYLRGANCDRQSFSFNLCTMESALCSSGNEAWDNSELFIVLMCVKNDDDFNKAVQNLVNILSKAQKRSDLLLFCDIQFTEDKLCHNDLHTLFSLCKVHIQTLSASTDGKDCCLLRRLAQEMAEGKTQLFPYEVCKKL